MSLPEEVTRLLPQWKQEYREVYAVQLEQNLLELSSLDCDTFILRPLCTWEYELLVREELRGKDDFGKYILYLCILWPSVDTLPLEIENFLLSAIRTNSGFDNIKAIEETLQTERNLLNAQAPGGMLRQLRALLFTYGSVSWKDIDDLNLTQISERIAAIEHVMGNNLIDLGGGKPNAQRMVRPRNKNKPSPNSAA